MLKAAFQVHAALAQKRFARLALDGTGGTMKSFAQRGGQSFLATPGSIGVPDYRANVELFDPAQFRGKLKKPLVNPAPSCCRIALQAAVIGRALSKLYPRNARTERLSSQRAAIARSLRSFRKTRP